MFLLFCFACLGTLIGLVFSNKFKDKYLLYQELYDFFTYYKLQIKFSHTIVSEIILTYYSNKNKYYFPYLNFIDYLTNKNLKENNSFNIDVLNETENELIKRLICGIGKYSTQEEYKNTENIINNLEVLTIDSKQKYKKYANLSIKLGLCFGALIGILLM